MSKLIASWDKVREKKEKALEKAQRLVQVHGEFVVLVEEAHNHVHQQKATGFSEVRPLRQALDHPESSY